MALTNAQKFINLGMAFPLATEVGDAIGNATASNPAVAALTPIATADATDLPTVLVLANANKAKINQIIAALQA